MRKLLKRITASNLEDGQPRTYAEILGGLQPIGESNSNLGGEESPRVI